MLNAHSKGKRDFRDHRSPVALIRAEITDLGSGVGIAADRSLLDKLFLINAHVVNFH